MTKTWCELCDLPLEQCGHSMEGPSFVWVSGGGRCFHARSNCEALTDGQKLADGYGQNIREIQQVAMAKALAMGRIRCAGCFP